MDKIKEWLPPIAIIGILYFIFFALGITCPIKFVTGISCAGCGMTRAWLSLLRLDFRSAVYYHPLFWLPPIALAVIIFKERLPKLIYKILIFTTICLFAIIYLYRMFCGNTIVVFQPENGIFFRIARLFFY